MPDSSDWIADFLREEALPEAYRGTITRVAEPLAHRLQAMGAGRREPLVAGVCGAQGSGKTTLCAVVARLLRRRGLKVAVLSLDDLYLSRARRADLAAHVHPLFATRGPPGTHDIPQGLALLEALSKPGPTRLPRFDKATDDPVPPDLWPEIQGPVDLVLLEGWCVGASPQPAEALPAPVNRLEAEEDPQGVWRAHANAELAGPYQVLFGRIDHLTLLRAPGFEVVAPWRTEQEDKLRRRRRATGQVSDRAMAADQIAAFIQLYERLTRHILATLHERADLVIELETDRTMRPTQR